jgi:hypothetical protein
MSFLHYLFRLPRPADLPVASSIVSSVLLKRDEQIFVFEGVFGIRKPVSLFDDFGVNKGPVCQIKVSQQPSILVSPLFVIFQSDVFPLYQIRCEGCRLFGKVFKRFQRDVISQWCPLQSTEPVPRCPGSPCHRRGPFRPGRFPQEIELEKEQ